MTEDDAKLKKTEEWRTWVFLTVVLAPLLAVAIVGSYGLAVWIYQMFAGPPTY
jgi:periplasmic nitrate reductase NapE